MSKVIKNGTVVTHDLTYKADILIEGSKISEIGQNLSGDTELDATGCYVVSIRIPIWKCHLWAPIQAMILRAVLEPVLLVVRPWL